MTVVEKRKVIVMSERVLNSDGSGFSSTEPVEEQESLVCLLDEFVIAIGLLDVVLVVVVVMIIMMMVIVAVAMARAESAGGGGKKSASLNGLL